MRRVFTIYGACLLALLIAGLLWSHLTRTAGIEGAFAQLGKGEAQYQEARERILLSVTDPAPLLYSFLANPSVTTTAKVQALKIMQELSYRQSMPRGGEKLAPLLRAPSREVRIGALLTMEKIADLGDSVDAVTRVYREEADSAVYAQAFRTLRACVAPLVGRLSAAAASADSLAVDSCLRALERWPTGRAIAYPALVKYFRGRGDTLRATEFARRTGVVNTWWTMGGFDNHRMTGFDRDFGPEGAPFDPKATFETATGERVGWNRLQRPVDALDLEIQNLFARTDNTIAYFFTYVTVPAGREALLTCGSDDAERIWLNDSLVLSNRVYRGTVADDDAAKVHLNAGTNTLLVKIAQDVGGWGMIVRLVDLRGEGMADVSWTLEPQLRDR